jgi:hypothetical protein
MGFLKNTVNHWKMAEAAVVVQNLLEARGSLYELDRPAKDLANHLVGLVWAKCEAVMDGRRGQRPHKISIAAAALANGIEMFTPQGPNWHAIIGSLGTLLEEMGNNGALYPLNEIDYRFLGAAADALNETFAGAMEALDSEFAKKS